MASVAKTDNVSRDIDIMCVHRSSIEEEIKEIEKSIHIIAVGDGVPNEILWLETMHEDLHKGKDACRYCTCYGQ